MSFFFDILTKDGFVLVSERRLQTVTNGAEKNETLRKIEINPEYPSADAVKCAIVVAGDDPCKALQFFKHACDKKDEGLRSVARDFAEQWTAFFSPSVESSYADARAHLVGYQVHSLNGIDFAIPQLWYWNTLEAQNSFHYSKADLERHLATFDPSVPNPHNNHLPRLIARDQHSLKLNSDIPRDEAIAQFSPEAEYLLLMEYFNRFGPFVTWGGDPTFYGSAQRVLEAFKPVLELGALGKIDTAEQITKLALDLLVEICRFLPEAQNTLAYDASGAPDKVKLTENDVHASWLQKGD